MRCALREVNLSSLTVNSDIAVGNSSVEATVNLSNCRVEGAVGITYCQVSGPTYFHHNTISGDANFEGSTFESDFSIIGLSARGELRFGSATLKKTLDVSQSATDKLVSLHGATISGSRVSFSQCNFAAEGVLGPAVIGEYLDVKNCDFTGPVTADISFTAEGRSDFTGSRFKSGLTARLSNTEVYLSRVEIQAPSVIGPSTAESRVESISPPKLIDIVGTNVANLTLSGADLSACRFAGAFNLDQLRINGPLQLVETVGWRARRKVLAEEHVWRFSRLRRRSEQWYPEACRPIAWPMPRVPDESHSTHRRDRQLPEQRDSRDYAWRKKGRDEGLEIAAIYRALRKGLEDSKDEPGAADFYYGEMEMRRKAAPRGFERTLLGAYWLLSGYGLRAWRAILALITLVLVSSVVLAVIGFQPSRLTIYRPGAPNQPGGAPVYQLTTTDGPTPGWSTGLEYAVQSTTSLLRAPTNPPILTPWGQAIEVVLRLGGPALLALAVLAIRGRIKR
jgi:uncharacterized protein YjbI with pentapeptide repeats